MIVKMPTKNSLIRESYLGPLHNVVTIETVQQIMEDETSQFFTSVSWGNDSEEEAVFENDLLEEAINLHNRLCYCFRKNTWFWKPVNPLREAENALIPGIAYSI